MKEFCKSVRFWRNNGEVHGGISESERPLYPRLRVLRSSTSDIMRVFSGLEVVGGSEKIRLVEADVQNDDL